MCLWPVTQVGQYTFTFSWTLSYPWRFMIIEKEFSLLFIWMYKMKIKGAGIHNCEEHTKKKRRRNTIDLTKKPWKHPTPSWGNNGFIIKRCPCPFCPTFQTLELCALNNDFYRVKKISVCLTQTCTSTQQVMFVILFDRWYVVTMRSVT